MTPLANAHRLDRFAVLAGLGLALFRPVCLADVSGNSQSGPPRSIRFVIRGDLQFSEAETMSKELRQLQRDLSDSLGTEPIDESIEILVFRNRTRFRRHVMGRYPQAAGRRALFVRGPGRGRIYVYRSRNFDLHVRHETTHALLHASLPLVPLWLDEGLAQYFELPANQRVSEHPHLRTLQWAMRRGYRPQLSVLENKSDGSHLSRQDYRDAWGWVHFLLNGPAPAAEVLRKYLSDLRAGVPPGRFSHRLQNRLPDAQHQLVAHIRATRLQR